MTGLPERFVCERCAYEFPIGMLMPFVDNEDKCSFLCPVCALISVREVHGIPTIMFKSERNLAKLKACQDYLTLHYSAVPVVGEGDGKDNLN